MKHVDPQGLDGEWSCWLCSCGTMNAVGYSCYLCHGTQPQYDVWGKRVFRDTLAAEPGGTP